MTKNNNTDISKAFQQWWNQHHYDLLGHRMLSEMDDLDPERLGGAFKEVAFRAWIEATSRGQSQ